MCEHCEKCALINQLTWLSKNKNLDLSGLKSDWFKMVGSLSMAGRRRGGSVTRKGAGPFCVVLSGLGLVWWSLFVVMICELVACVLVLEPSCGVSAALNNADDCVEALLQNAVFHLACCGPRGRQKTCVTGTILNPRPN